MTETNGIYFIFQYNYKVSDANVSLAKISINNELTGICVATINDDAPVRVYNLNGQLVGDSLEDAYIKYIMIGTFWSLVPSIVAITLALITKEVYSSLFIGVVIGAVFFAIGSGTGLDGFIMHLLNETVGDGNNTASYGIIHSIADSWNVGILIFLVMLGTMVALMNKAGGSATFAEWATHRVKNRRSAQIVTVLLGIIIFIDDYFNCLTVGSVMKPITDRQHVCKEKLAWLIDSTAAPVCIIAPISSWAAAVSGFVTEGENGLALFCQAIPFNFYAFFTIIFIFVIIMSKYDYPQMRKFYVDEQEGEDLLNGEDYAVAHAKLDVATNSIVPEINKRNSRNGSVLDLIVPIFILIVFCIIGMLYSGGYFHPTNGNYMDFVNAFATSDASIGLVIGSMTAIIVSIIWYVSRRVLAFNEAMSCLIKGFEAMVPAILILCLAWSLKSMTDSLGAATYVAGLVSDSAGTLQVLLPAIIFVVAMFLAFATGTSWGTFGILIPICIAVFPVGEPLRIISISACMAGAVCGDHISPISDTTIMASAGAECKHVNHVSSQLPYALTVAAISFVCYIIAGMTHNLGIWTSALSSWTFGIVCLVAFYFWACRKKKSKG